MKFCLLVKGNIVQENASVNVVPLSVYKGELQESTQTEKGKGGLGVCEPQEPEIGYKALRRSTRQVRRPSKCKVFILSLKY